jgi:ACT domain-containing protein
MQKKIRSLRDYIPAKIYIRVEVNNSKGILSKVTEKFSLLNLSVEKVDQHLFNDSKNAFLLFILVNSNKTSIKKIKLKFKRSKLFHNLEIFPIVDIENV